MIDIPNLCLLWTFDKNIQDQEFESFKRHHHSFHSRLYPLHFGSYYILFSSQNISIHERLFEHILIFPWDWWEKEGWIVWAFEILTSISRKMKENDNALLRKNWTIEKDFLMIFHYHSSEIWVWIGDRLMLDKG